MYEQFYQLAHAPFHITPDPRFLYLGPGHKEALASLIYGIEQRKGFIVITGEVGLGKTTIVRTLLAMRDRKSIVPVYIFDVNVSFKGLLEAIYRELGLDPAGNDVPMLVHRLHRVLIDAYEQGRTVVLIIDEAQNMPLETLEQMRVLSNLEKTTDKLLQVILAGQPELSAKLDAHELRQLKQRIAVRSTIKPLTKSESRAYIEHRLTKAGGSAAAVFTGAALRRIIRHGRGIPRILNTVCDAALVTGVGYGQKRVGRRIVREVIDDLEGRPRPRRPRWITVAAATAAVILLIGAVGMASYSAIGRVDDAAAAPAPSAVSVGVGGVPAPTGAKVVAAPTVRIVAPGDTLVKMAHDVYGFANRELIDSILRSNPEITNPDHITVGSSIAFPARAGSGSGTESAAAQGLWP